ncbi:MAG: alginate export family protein [Candidatus Delongbacteria bacterium]|nr:alginate export family protein [Candidatus Delongbacteria bacterium]
MKKWILILSLSLIQLTSGQDKPKQGLKLSFSYRFRYELMESTTSLQERAEDATVYTRNRTSLMAQYFFHSGMELAFKLTNEFRHYFAPNSRKFEIHEGLVDNLYFRWNSVAGRPIDLTIGRQNISLGEGFMVIEGTPNDGSRSFYFNALRLDYRFNKTNKVTVFVCSQEDHDDYLPLINDQNLKNLNDQPETGAGVYFALKYKSLDLEPYLIRRDIDDTDLRPFSGNINSLGCRIIAPFHQRKVTFTGEAAYQFGESKDESTGATLDRKAYGGHMYATLKLPSSIPFGDKLSIGGIFLSGDDPDTEELEGWDPMYARFPKWSESIIYTLTKEYGTSYWSNMTSLYAAINLKFSEQVYMILGYHRLGAQHTKPSIIFPGGAGTCRGDLFQARVHYKINSVLSGHIVLENFDPGSYYFDKAVVSNWGRAELLLQF